MSVCLPAKGSFIAPPSGGCNHPLVCLTPDCGEASKSRGLCTNCYQLARFEIAKNRTNWEELEALGLARPPQHGIGLNLFRLALTEARHKQSTNGNGKHTAKRKARR